VDGEGLTPVAAGPVDQVVPVERDRGGRRCRRRRRRPSESWL